MNKKLLNYVIVAGAEGAIVAPDTGAGPPPAPAIVIPGGTIIVADLM